MDSMRSLNTSLPRSTPRRQPPEQLLQAFKAAALSVTNLYKDAICEEAQARQAGYQEAIEELLNFLDKENLGLGDGEGWKIRQWATERLDSTAAAASDEEERDYGKHTRSASPVAQRKEASSSHQPPQQERSPQQQHSEPVPERRPSRSQSPRRGDSAVRQQPSIPATTNPASHSTDASSSVRPAVFTFSAGPTMPQVQEQDIDMQSSDYSDATSQEDSVSVSVLPRNPRGSHRHNNHARSSPRSSTRDSTTGLGSKRKLTFPDFFDLSGFGNGRDMFGGGKRGRFA